MIIRQFKERLCDGCRYKGNKEVPCTSLFCEQEVSHCYIIKILNDDYKGGD